MDLTAKVLSHERKAQLCARELVVLRKSAGAAQRHVQELEEEARKNKMMLKVSQSQGCRAVGTTSFYQVAVICFY